MAARVGIFGGAGFLGSHITERFRSADWQVTVIDGLLPDTGGSSHYLAGLTGVRVVNQRVEDLPGLQRLLGEFDLIVDAMAWTSHLLALERPRYDLELNASSHLVLLEALRYQPNCRAIYLGSRGQYGNPAVESITEDTVMSPLDIQGIHKLAAESYYRVFASLHHMASVSLRIPNCYGERQPATGRDVGLVGGFIRDALQGKDIEIYGRDRKRNFVYAGDLAEIVLRLGNTAWSGFQAFNVGGLHLTIHSLATSIVEGVGSGQCKVKPLPAEVRAIDAGSAGLDDNRLKQLIGPLPQTEFPIALQRTIDWVKAPPIENLS